MPNSKRKIKERLGQKWKDFTQSDKALQEALKGFTGVDEVLKQMTPPLPREK